MCSVRHKTSFSKKHWQRRKRVVVLNIHRENTSGGAETDSAGSLAEKFNANMCRKKNRRARNKNGVKRSRKLSEPSGTARILIFTRHTLEFYFDFFMRRAVLLLPVLLCATRKLKFAR